MQPRNFFHKKDSINVQYVFFGLLILVSLLIHKCTTTSSKGTKSTGVKKQEQISNVNTCGPNVSSDLSEYVAQKYHISFSLKYASIFNK